MRANLIVAHLGPRRRKKHFVGSKEDCHEDNERQQVRNAAEAGTEHRKPGRFALNADTAQVQFQDGDAAVVDTAQHRCAVLNTANVGTG